MIDCTLRHYYPGTDPLDLTIHQSLTMLENMQQIESSMAGEVDHRAIVEREARKARLTDG